MAYTCMKMTEIEYQAINLVSKRATINKTIHMIFSPDDIVPTYTFIHRIELITSPKNQLLP